MSSLTFKNSFSKRYYIVDWNRDVFLEKVFSKSTYIYSANILRGVLLKLLNGVLKNTGRCYAKILKDDLKALLVGIL